MPTDPTRRSLPEDADDPNQTLFFDRRKKKSVNLLPLIVICTLVLGSGALVVWAVSQVGRKSVDELAHAPTPDPFPGRPIVPTADAQGLENPAVGTPRANPPAAAGGFDHSKPVRPAQAVNPASAPPASGDTVARINLNVDDPDNAQVRAEVLRRIDLMPGVSAANKDKLYASVDHARGMGRVLTIPFEKGDAVVRVSYVDKLKQQLADPQIKKLTDDPTVVFVVLGYADQKGNEKSNVEISQSRARSVLDTLRDKCGFQNVMHAVAMGGSNLFSTQQADKNRVVEIWAVLP